MSQYNENVTIIEIMNMKSLDFTKLYLINKEIK